jgi:periplasmic nitrate reductase NapE
VLTPALVQMTGHKPGVIVAVTEEADKKREWRAILLLGVILAPVLSIAIVGGYGFVVWISQMILGPPGV